MCTSGQAQLMETERRYSEFTGLLLVTMHHKGRVGVLGGGRGFFAPPPSLVVLRHSLDWAASLSICHLGPIKYSCRDTARQVYEKPRILFDGDGAKALDNITADIKGPGPIALVRQKNEKSLALSQILLEYVNLSLVTVLI